MTLSVAASLEDQLTRAAAEFKKLYRRPAKFAAVAPGRVNLIGEHTDYNDGFVLPMAIQRQTLLLADRRPDAKARVASTGEPEPAAFDVSPKLAPGDPAWSNYVRGVVAVWMREGNPATGFDALVDSTVPLGSGLSSSAAIEVSTCTLLEAMNGKTLAPAAKALLCQKAEHEFPKVPCGIMDQFISVGGQAGHAMLLDCRSRETRMVPLDDPEVSVLIANTNVRHALTGGEYRQRREQCEAGAKALGVKALRDVTEKALNNAMAKLDPLVFRRARHVVTEIARTLKAADAMGTRSWDDVGKLMHQSHLSLRDDYEVSCSELDLMVELAMGLGVHAGVYGSRMTGGGFGGCTVSLVRTDRVEAVAKLMHDRYRERSGIEPTIFATQPAAGARVVNI
ncbi:MAG: galactokinase [Planctomycetota bacterium]|nr:galactokinase [Planctomycetota bacterium]